MNFEITSQTLCVLAPTILFWVMALPLYFFTHVVRYFKPFIPVEKMSLNSVSVRDCVLYTIAQQILVTAHAFSTTDYSTPVYDAEEHVLWKLGKILLLIPMVDMSFSVCHEILHLPGLYSWTHKWHHEIRYVHVFASIYDHPLQRLLENVSLIACFTYLKTDQFTSTVFICLLTMVGMHLHTNIWSPLNLIFSNTAENHSLHHAGHVDENMSLVFCNWWDVWNKSLVKDQANAFRKLAKGVKVERKTQGSTSGNVLFDYINNPIAAKGIGGLIF